VCVQINQIKSERKSQVDVLMFSVEAEWSPTGDVGDRADANVLDAVCE